MKLSKVFNMSGINSKAVAGGLLVIVTLVVWHSSVLSAATPTGRNFPKPQEAVKALEQASSTKNLAALRDIFGPALDEIANPDRVQATNELMAFAAALHETNRLVPLDEKRMAIEYGRDGTVFPVPLV
jgi:hypothetical protein